MSRIVRRPGEIVIDHTGKLSGRGAYLHNQRSCWERGMNGALAHALKVELTEKDRLILQSFLDNLTDDEAPQSVNLSQKEKPIE
jgi:predicted RNA-binding protein YlxR (DUF448 family)